MHTKIQINAHSSTTVRTYQVIQSQHDFDYTRFRIRRWKCVQTNLNARKYSFNRFPIEDDVISVEWKTLSSKSLPWIAVVVEGIQLTILTVILYSESTRMNKKLLTDLLKVPCKLQSEESATRYISYLPWISMVREFDERLHWKRANGVTDQPGVSYMELKKQISPAIDWPVDSRVPRARQRIVTRACGVTGRWLWTDLAITSNQHDSWLSRTSLLSFPIASHLRSNDSFMVIEELQV